MRKHKYEIRPGLTNKWLIVYSDVLNQYGVKKIKAGVNSKRDAIKIARKLSS